MAKKARRGGTRHSQWHHDTAAGIRPCLQTSVQAEARRVAKVRTTQRSQISTSFSGAVAAKAASRDRQQQHDEEDGDAEAADGRDGGDKGEDGMCLTVAILSAILAPPP
jgi:hypothetical protein